jgi:hypothetical protein
MTGFDKLDAAMAKHKAKQEEVRVATDKAAQQRDKFMQEFGVFLATVAHPTLEAIGNHLKQGGHDFHVEAGDDGASITLHVYVDSTRADHMYSLRSPSSHPQVTLRADAYREEVSFVATRVFSAGGSQGGGEGKKYALSQLSANIIREVAINVISDSLTK